jgi:hypothetical protein
MKGIEEPEDNTSDFLFATYRYPYLCIIGYTINPNVIIKEINELTNIDTSKYKLKEFSLNTLYDNNTLYSRKTINKIKGTGTIDQYLKSIEPYVGDFIIPIKSYMKYDEDITDITFKSNIKKEWSYDLDYWINNTSEWYNYFLSDANLCTPNIVTKGIIRTS